MPGKWRWLAVVAAALPQAVLAAPHTVVALRTDAADLSITSALADPAAGPGMEGKADLDLSLGGVRATLAGSAQTANRDDFATGSSDLNGGKVSFDTAWKSGWTAFDLKAEQRFQNTAADAIAASPIFLSHSEQQTQGQSATATATLTPFASASLALGASAGDGVTAQRQWVAGAAPYESRVETRSERAFATLTWQPLPAVTLEAGTATGTTDMAMTGGVSGKAAYGAMEPKASLTVRPWRGAALTVGAERTVTPLDSGNLAGFAAATGRPEDANLRPDSARELDLHIKQSFGSAVSLEAGFSDAQLLSTTVLLPAANGQTPASIAGGRRQTFDASLSLSLGAIGLPRTHITSKAVWRRSRIHDPLTDTDHRLSGEIPHEASVALTKELPRHHLTVGVDGKLGAMTEYYQAAQQTQVAQASSVGAFVEFDPGPYSLRLSVDGLGSGAAQTDTFYRGVRGSSAIDHVAHSDIAGPTFGLSFTKSLDG